MPWPVIAAAVGGGLGLLGASKTAKSTDYASKLASEAQVKAAEIAAANALERQQQLFDLQKEAKELDIFKFDPAERFLIGSYQASPLQQKLDRQQFYNQKALADSLKNRLVSFDNVSRSYVV